MSDLTKRISTLSPRQRKLLWERLRQNGSHGSSALIPRQSRTENFFPLSFAQERLWVVEQLQPGNPAYIISAAAGFNLPVKIAVLEQSLNAIVQRHEILRTTFPACHGKPVQRIASSMMLTLPVVDLRHIPEPYRAEQAAQLAAEQARRPFDLASGPLLRTRLLRLSEDRSVTLIALHHIIFDGWCTSLLVQEMMALYAAFSRGQPSPLPELPIQYADYAVWQREWLQGEVLERLLSYWRKQLQGLSPLELPLDHPRPPVFRYRGARKTLPLSKDLTQALHTLSRQQNATLFMTLLAAFKTLLYMYTGQDDIAVGTSLANRTRAETAGLIGSFVNMVVLRANLAGDPSFLELLRRVREVCLSAYAHQDLPFEKLLKELNPQRDPSRNPLYQVVFQMNNTPAPFGMAPGENYGLPESGYQWLETGTAMAELNMHIDPVMAGPDGGSTAWNCVLEYRTDLFEDATIGRMLRHFQTLLDQIIADPTKRLSRLRFSPDAEINCTATDFAEANLN
ncbi:MAG TPA: condensation domain-containing protein [Pyrinomonadaceae bacterium]|jgi:hypothetical protein